MAKTIPTNLHGIDLRRATKIAEELGCVIQFPRGAHGGHGEIVFAHPQQIVRVRVNGRRKDSPRSLTKFLQHIINGTQLGSALNGAA